MGFLADFRAATRANLMRAFRMSGSSATTALNHLEDLGLLVASSEKNLYVTERCVQMLAARDRVDVGRLVEVTYLDPEGEAAIRERDHDSAVAEVAAWLRGAGMQVAAGWRWVVSWDDGQLVPDLWVLLMVPGREEGIWIPIEVEFSAKSKKRIEEKLRSYRLAPIRLNQTFPILVITGEAMPAKRFDDQAGDLPILTTTLKEFRTGVWEGPESVWRRKGRPVGLSSLAEEYYGHLRQETGRELDYSTPSLEVWDKLIGKESIWSDFQTAGIDDDIDLEWPSIDPPPISPTPPSAPVGKASTAQEKVLDEARAEPSANNPVSTPLPPTPPPVPVGKAATPQDWGRQRSHVLSRVDSLVARADSRAYISLKQGKLTEEERLCLHRVRAIITYGANRHFQAEDILVEKWLQICLRLKDMHLRAIRSSRPTLLY